MRDSSEMVWVCSNSVDHSGSAIERRALTVRGVVQGVGFRPFASRLAQRLQLSGWVRNENGQVRIEVQGPVEAVEQFSELLLREAPTAARIDQICTVRLIPCLEELGFAIVTSRDDQSPLPLLPPDLAICAECRAEILDPVERRYRYPFTNCTQCGPRWSIVTGLPYDRPRTSMNVFAMCPACTAEYSDPNDRRYHAQPIACPACGPRLTLEWAGEHLRCESESFRERHASAGGTAPNEIPFLDDVVSEIGRLLRAGKIVGMLGLGGFQLLVDATNNAAVAELRRRKRRPDKPFAVLLANLEEARLLCELSDEESKLMIDAAAPIVLVRRRLGTTTTAATGNDVSIAEAVAPKNPYLGVMLPYTPLHELVIRAAGRPLVCTSGNVSEEPMAITPDEGRRRLSEIADILVIHDRPVVRPVDDSVVRVGPTGPMILRRARGYAPLPIPLVVAAGKRKPRTWLAVGGHLKNVVGITVAGQAVLGSHIGDLDNPAAMEVFRRAIDDLIGFFQLVPEGVVCDLHPDYASTRVAEQWAQSSGIPLLRVQHHHAHAAACMAEHGLVDNVLAFCWDGTGYGDDGTVWGGEVLLCDGPNYRRFAHLRPFPLPGGDRAAREPHRSAAGVLFAAFGDQAAAYLTHRLGPSEWRIIRKAIERRLNTPTTTSMGRLFDAIAYLCGLGDQVSFQGQAAMALEYATADRNEEHAAYPVVLRTPDDSQGAFRSSVSVQQQSGSAQGSDDNRPMWLDWQPMLETALADLRAGVAVSRISARFHNGLAEAAVAVAELAAQIRPNLTVVLSGGCFQNARLTDHLYLRLTQRGFRCVLPRRVPPGDGGLALGQLFIAAMHDAAGLA